MKRARIFTDESLLQLEVAVAEAQKRFNEVPEFSGLFILKHHFSLHSALDIKLGGPGMNRTAKMYENKLQWVKREASRCNYKNPIFSVVSAWSLHSAHDLVHLTNSSRHSVEVVYASDESIVSEVLVEDMDKEEYGCLQCLLAGGGSVLYAFSYVESLRLHGERLVPGSFILHWSDEYPTQCLALVARIVQLRKEEDTRAVLWLEIVRFSRVEAAASGQQLCVDRDAWSERVVDPSGHVRVLVPFEELRFTVVRQTERPGAYMFLV